MAFSQESLDFLFINHIQDSRSWFAEHHDEYQTHLIEPLRDLVIDLTPQMLEIDDQFVTEPRIDKTICRIWRDLRYTRNPSLYRDVMWIIFKRDRMHSTDYPGIYFEINCNGFGYGCGFYRPSTSYMYTLRSLIIENHPLFQAALKAYQNQNIFQMDGDRFKKPHYPDQPEAVQEWLDRKSIGFYAESDNLEQLFSPDLSQKIGDDLTRLAPIYRLLLEAALIEQHNNRYHN